MLSAEVYKKMGRLNDAGRVYGRGFAKTGHVVFLGRWRTSTSTGGSRASY